MELFGSSAYDASSQGSHPGRLYNLWADRVQDGGRTRRLLRSVAGMTLYHAFPAGPVRAMLRGEGPLFAISGGSLNVRNNDGSNTVCGSVVATGNADMSRNGSPVTLTAGGTYYVWNGTTLQTPSVPITSPDSVCFLAGRTILTAFNSAQFCWSDIADPTTFPGLNVATAEQRDDIIVRAFSAGGTLFLFGSRSIELWAPDSFGASAFGLIGGGVVDRGLKAFGLIQQIGGGFFFVGDDDIAYMMGGTTLRAVSTAAVNTAIRAGTATSCEYWEDRGHKFAAIVFSDRPAWVFDLTTEEWFERGVGIFGAWPVQRSCENINDWLVGGTDGRVWRLSGVQDQGGLLRRIAVSYPIYNDGQHFTLAEVELFSAAGTGTANVTLEVAKDRVTFGNARVLPLSVAGQFGKRTVFRELGRARDMTVRATITDAVDVPLYADARIRLA